MQIREKEHDDGVVLPVCEGVCTINKSSKPGFRISHTKGKREVMQMQQDAA